ncbi:MAG: hypothetical protein HC888_01565 [Candidatus Competibacteraceae bacterium]|nr:hypothetical protein [Candidatus Competibacteraceae bacterium]
MEGEGHPDSAQPQTFNPGADWVTDFTNMTQGISSPELFRKWVAIYVVSAAMQRNVWAVTNGRPLYPHLYTILVAPPGIGKTKILSKGREMLIALKPDVHVAFSSLTAASLIDNLHDAVRRHIRPDAVPAAVVDNCLSIVSSELGVLLPTYDPSFMNTLQDLYDCLPYSQKRRTRDISIEIPNPQINILAACTPAYLQGTLPEALGLKALPPAASLSSPGSASSPTSSTRLPRTPRSTSHSSSVLRSSTGFTAASTSPTRRKSSSTPGTGAASLRSRITRSSSTIALGGFLTLPSCQ